MLKKGAKLIGLACALQVSNGLAGDVLVDLEAKIKNKTPSLFTCAIPSLLKNKKKLEKPEKYSSLVGVVSSPVIADGCSVEVYGSEDIPGYYFMVNGGLSGGVDIVLGPISADFYGP